MIKSNKWLGKPKEKNLENNISPKEKQRISTTDIYYETLKITK